MRLSYKFILFIILALTSLSIFGLVAVQRINAPSTTTLEATRISTGSKSGTYFAFAQTLAKVSSNDIIPLTSAGTAENLQALQEGSVDFAIVQNDLSQYAYLGIKGNNSFKKLRFVLPLFPEYVRILVSKDSKLTYLGDLKGKRVCLGDYGSGTYYNAIDIFQAIDMRQGVDFIPVRSGSYNCLERMNAGENIDAVFMTSNSVRADVLALTREIRLPEGEIDRITDLWPYYSKVNLSDSSGISRNYLSIYAYLATHENTDSAIVRALTDEIIVKWPDIQKQMPSLGSLTVIQNNGAVPYHSGAKSVLYDQGLHSRNWWAILVFVGWIAFFALSMFVEGQKTNYNRMGESSLSKGIRLVLFKGFGKISRLIIGLSLLLIFITAAVVVLRFSEQYFAQVRHQRSPFLDMSIRDNIVWLFTYISSGFASEGVYPQSTLGQIIAASLAILGIVGPITGVIFLVNFFAKQAQKNMEGVGLLNASNHVIICGWNEKAPGIIYTLTGSDVDQQKNVVIVADFLGEFPLEKYNFNPSYVQYCRGKASDIKVLEKARTHKANSMIVLGDYLDGSDENIGSILAVMNARKLNPDIHICAEIEYETNRDFFISCGCNTLISPSLITTRLATAAVISPLIVDYFLDVITYHNFDEVYSIRVNQVNSLKEYVGKPIRELELSLLTKGANLVGLLKDRTMAQSLYNADFSDDSGLIALVDAKNSTVPLQADDIIIYSSIRRSRINNIEKNFDAADTKNLPATEFQINTRTTKNILAIGEPSTLVNLEDNLKSHNPDINFKSINLLTKKLTKFEHLKKYLNQEYDLVIILAPSSEKLNATSDNDLDGIDAKSILRTRLVNEALARKNHNTKIITEIMNIKNRDLFLQNGTDTVLPTKLMIERLLTKEVYDKSNILEYYISLLNLRDGVHLHAHTVKQGDGFHGTSYGELLNTEIEGIRIIGWLPHAQRDALTNKQKDFSYHFRTVLDDRLKQKHVKENDVLIMIVRDRDRYYSE